MVAAIQINPSKSSYYMEILLFVKGIIAWAQPRLTVLLVFTNNLYIYIEINVYMCMFVRTRLAFICQIPKIITPCLLNSFNFDIDCIKSKKFVVFIVVVVVFSGLLLFLPLVHAFATT